MELTAQRRMTRALRVLVAITFICNLIVLPMVPGLVGIGRGGGWSLLVGMSDGSGKPLPLLFLAVCWKYLYRIWQEPAGVVLTLFLFFCGVCTAVILFQGLRVLREIERGKTFTLYNAGCARVAGVCCFCISALALVRFLWSLITFASWTVFFTYNTLFIPVFIVAGLFMLVLSALIRQAAAIKSENDLTI